ncbi:endonuclease YncB(thermonuclease family) [Rhodopseudomonas julia]|uniref:Endonuclease YncB(Thermonuclease family) n=1 Tax=Rhodopseudomonas julia TaxID=200617 RepID=A0ABU0C4W7_9BRAD|nr:thermonuclease family protein [Rhodopseudomonas julia]MDQ0325561.1 endonuclease YncB(thermonuclease family) [Rhodopseudomonas julia]
MFLYRFALSLLTFAVPALPAAAGSELPGLYRAVVERVVDGDTLAVRATIWLDQEVRVLVRLRGIDAPELRARCLAEKLQALAATDALAALVTDPAVTLSEVEGDKYGGRVVADVRDAKGRDLGALLLQEGLVRAYAGGHRDGWCGKLSLKAD